MEDLPHSLYNLSADYLCAPRRQYVNPRVVAHRGFAHHPWYADCRRTAFRGGHGGPSRQASVPNRRHPRPWWYTTISPCAVRPTATRRGFTGAGLSHAPETPQPPSYQPHPPAGSPITRETEDAPDITHKPRSSSARLRGTMPMLRTQFVFSNHVFRHGLGKLSSAHSETEASQQ